jgi:exopolyphosphatase/guanosine-5'-triphosphate,3'-diphosphate pyrophosphatase
LSLNEDDRELIESAALLANVGYLINFDKHHKHGFHLIANSELPGFERQQLALLANVARYHRGSAPKPKHENFSELAPCEQQRVAQMAAILRLALALDRSHRQQIESVRAEQIDGRVKITVEASGDPEVDLWAARRKVELFEKVFRYEVDFSTESPAEEVTNDRSARAQRS